MATFLRRTNEGTTWTETSFAQVTANPNDAYRMYGQKMAIDPNNPNIVYVGTPLNGLFVTTNGGATWQSVSAVPVSVADLAVTLRALLGSNLIPQIPISSSLQAMAMAFMKPPMPAPLGPN